MKQNHLLIQTEFQRDTIYTILIIYGHIVMLSLIGLKEHLKCPVFYLPPAYSSLYNYITDTNIDTQPITFVNFKFETRLPLKQKNAKYTQYR